jgi:hypothetical protein
MTRDMPTERFLALPPGTWVNCRGVRRFVPTDPDWHPSDDPHDIAALNIFAALAAEPSAIVPPNVPVHRHICDCGCLLFGVENCPQCAWLAQVADESRTA